MDSLEIEDIKYLSARLIIKWYSDLIETLICLYLIFKKLRST